MITIHILSILIGFFQAYGFLAPSHQITNEFEEIKYLLKSMYLSKRLKVERQGRKVPATFVVSQIIDKIDRFRGFVTISSNAVIVWFFTFFLFFIQFGVQAPSVEDDPNLSHNCTN